MMMGWWNIKMADTESRVHTAKQADWQTGGLAYCRVRILPPLDFKGER